MIYRTSSVVKGVCSVAFGLTLAIVSSNVPGFALHVLAQCQSHQVQIVSGSCQSQATTLVHHQKHQMKTIDDSAKSIVGTAAGSKDLTTLVAAVKQGQLVETLNSKGPFTVFAPVNSAFAKLPKSTIEALLKDENRPKLQAILKFHVVSGKVLAKDVVKLSKAKTVLGKDLSIKVKDGQVWVSGAKVIGTDIKCSNGVVHLIDSVMIPPKGKTIVETAAGNKNFSTLVSLVKKAGLVETLNSKGPFTVFAPTNDAFKKLPEATVKALLSAKGKKDLVNVLKYHVVPGKVKAADVVKIKKAKTVLGQEVSVKVSGKNVMINGAKVIMTDITCENGVIHVIDTVLVPSSNE